MSIYSSGKTIVALLYPLLKAVQVYDVNNDVVINTAKKFVTFVDTLFATISSLEFVRYRDYIFFNKQRLKYEIDNYANLQFLNSRLKILRIKSLTFLPGIEQQELIDFVAIFKEDKVTFLKEFVLKRYPHIKVEFLKAGEEPDAHHDHALPAQIIC